VTIRPQKLICNVPCPGFVSLLSIQTANVAVTVGNATDAYSYSAGAAGSFLDCPTLSPANRVIIAGNYSGLCPNGRPHRIGAAVQAQLETWWAATMPKEVTKTQKGRRIVKTLVPARFPFDIAAVLETEAPGPYPERSLFLFVATFQGPATLVG
jgi:hypothetical protein